MYECMYAYTIPECGSNNKFLIKTYMPVRNCCARSARAVIGRMSAIVSNILHFTLNAKQLHTKLEITNIFLKILICHALSDERLTKKACAREGCALT